MILAVHRSAVTVPSTLVLPHDPILIEVGYTLVATLVVGAIIGGLSGRLILPAPERSS